MKTIFKFLVIIAVLTVVWACDMQRVYDTYYPIENSAWHKDSLLVFNVPVEDTLQNHNLYINVRNNVDYGFSNLWLFVEVAQPGGMAVRDTFEMVLADPSGKWLGEGFGGLKTREAIYRRNVFFPASGEYKFTIQQGMRKEVLEGISDVGLRIEKID